MANRCRGGTADDSRTNATEQEQRTRTAAQRKKHTFLSFRIFAQKSVFIGYSLGIMVTYKIYVTLEKSYSC